MRRARSTSGHRRQRACPAGEPASAFTAGYSALFETARDRRFLRVIGRPRHHHRRLCTKRRPDRPSQSNAARNGWRGDDAVIPAEIYATRVRLGVGCRQPTLSQRTLSSGRCGGTPSRATSGSRPVVTADTSGHRRLRHQRLELGDLELQDIAQPATRVARRDRTGRAAALSASQIARVVDGVVEHRRSTANLGDAVTVHLLDQLLNQLRRVLTRRA